MSNILFVCTANICRSPVAEGLMREKLAAAGITDWIIDSAGTWVERERGASQYSIDVLAERGIQIGNHQSKGVERIHIDAANLILCMETGHAEALQIEFMDARDKIFVLSEMVGHRYSVSDPYGRSRNHYERMLRDVDGLLTQGFDRIVALATAVTDGT